MLVVALHCHGIRGQSSAHHSSRWRLGEAVVHVSSQLVSNLCSVLRGTIILIHQSSDVSRNSELSLQCYLRADEPKRGVDGADDLGNDLFLGGLKFVPDFENMGNQDQWYEMSGGSGKIQIGVSYTPNYGTSLSIDDFELTTVIGKGSFGKVRNSIFRSL
jgi:serum/glucocorticoid-regulated kinase 2